MVTSLGGGVFDERGQFVGLGAEALVMHVEELHGDVRARQRQYPGTPRTRRQDVDHLSLSSRIHQLRKAEDESSSATVGSRQVEPSVASEVPKTPFHFLKAPM